jgi:hypothetical protein
MRTCSFMHSMWVEIGHSGLHGFIATYSLPACRDRTVDRDEARLVAAASAPGPLRPLVGRHWANCRVYGFRAGSKPFAPVA